MAEIHEKIVIFDQYCSKCVYADKSESEDPCWECLDEPTNFGSVKPVNFEPKEVIVNAKLSKERY